MRHFTSYNQTQAIGEKAPLFNIILQFYDWEVKQVWKSILKSKDLRSLLESLHQNRKNEMNIFQLDEKFVKRE